jgi:hypothetical protein
VHRRNGHRPHAFNQVYALDRNDFREQDVARLKVGRATVLDHFSLRPEHDIAQAESFPRPYVEDFMEAERHAAARLDIASRDRIETRSGTSQIGARHGGVPYLDWKCSCSRIRQPVVNEPGEKLRCVRGLFIEGFLAIKQLELLPCLGQAGLAEVPCRFTQKVARQRIDCAANSAPHQGFGRNRFGLHQAAVLELAATAARTWVITSRLHSGRYCVSADSHA